MQSFMNKFPLELVFLKKIYNIAMFVRHYCKFKMYSSWQLNCWCVHQFHNIMKI